MVFKHNETLANLYEGISKQIDPSTEKSTRQAPTLSNTDLSKDQHLLAEAYTLVEKKSTCKHAANGCKCDGCKECKANQNTKKVAPKKDTKKDTKKSFPFEKKEMKESLNFKDMFAAIMTESKVVCGTKINPEFQYDCVMKDGKEKVLKGESVLLMSDKLKSVKAAH